MHKGRAVCSAVGEIIFDHPAAMVEPIDRLRPARTFLMVSGTRDCATSEIEQILRSKISKTRIPKSKICKAWMPRHPRKIDSPAQMRATLLLAA